MCWQDELAQLSWRLSEAALRWEQIAVMIPAFTQATGKFMRKTFLFVAVLAWTGGAFNQTRGATVDFLKDIQPIFQDACVKCHGPEKQKGDLRLDLKAAAFKGGKDGAVIVAGQADKSDLYRRVTLPE